MPKRIIDGDALWASSKLERCPEWMIPEYSWLYPLADANGSFEITNLKAIHGRVAAIRPNFSIEVLTNILHEFNRFGLLFQWKNGGKTYAHWTGSERSGRLPEPSKRKRYLIFAPKVPKSLLRKYLEDRRAEVAKSHPDSHPRLIPDVRGGHPDVIRTGLDGVGFRKGLDGSGREPTSVGGGGSVDVGFEVDSTAGNRGPAAAAAFSSIGFDNPFGHPDFQAVWLRWFADRNGEWLTQVMEATIQECNQQKIGIPPQFFEAKRDVEKRENAEFMIGKAVPL